MFLMGGYERKNSFGIDLENESYIIARPRK